ncbi:hypothetical protein [Streptomyces cupreus]|uniref:Uncharacterized protein n=1 Tax=Streptomyces cupreus TaxID=2759956 RepID=A0A7X1J5V4_9ACTN|nr:hypothetical protein [Streptomyces cupreus]MBC2904754.1 hypothetical protein [Streptomyces cupreus]
MVFLPAAPAIAAVTVAIEVILGTIQLIATNARNRGQCLTIRGGARVKHRWGFPSYPWGIYAYPWRGRC